MSPPALNDDMLVFQGLEWNIPAAEHGTVFVHPGKNEWRSSRSSRDPFDGSVKGATAPPPPTSARHRRRELPGNAVTKRRVQDALFSPTTARKGLDSPHEIRGWRDAQPGSRRMEGAPATRRPASRDRRTGLRAGLLREQRRAGLLRGIPAGELPTFGGSTG